MKDTNKPVSTRIVFSITSIKCKELRIIEEYATEENRNKEINVTINFGTAYDKEMKSLNVSLRAWLNYSNEQTILAETVVENIFDIENFSSFITEGKITWPGEVWAQFVGISISHTRALFAQSLAGTVYQSSLIPVLDPLDVTRHFFPNSFKEDKVETSLEPSKKKSKQKENSH